MTLGETIKLLRTEQNMTQPELAEKARIEQSYLSKLENDKATPSFDIINRIAQALGLTGMALIHKLSHSYISEHLSHLPEIAAEYASVNELRERRTRRQLLLAAMLLLAGTALYLAGTKEFIKTDETWFYSSEGVFKAGEDYRQFQDSPIDEIGETGEEYEQRLLANRPRIEKAFLQIHQYLGPEFIRDVTGGQRLYYLDDSQENPRPLNVMLEIIGILIGLAGMLYAGYTVWRHHTRQ
jgi:transcriptional regulator with XRE-family HTH domain